MGAAIFPSQDAYRGPVSLLKEAYEETESRGAWMPKGFLHGGRPRPFLREISGRAVPSRLCVSVGVSKWNCISGNEHNGIAA